MANGCLAFEDTIKSVVDTFTKQEGFKAHYSKGAGLAEVFDPAGVRVYRAIRKGALGQPWIAMWFDSAHVTWGKTDDARDQDARHP